MDYMTLGPLRSHVMNSIPDVFHDDCLYSICAASALHSQYRECVRKCMFRSYYTVHLMKCPDTVQLRTFSCGIGWKGDPLVFEIHIRAIMPVDMDSGS